jgi:nucleotide-binding universal stress UspA family protein
MYKRILVPVDGSRASTQGLREALRLARDQKARLRIVHIVDEAALAQYPEAIDATGQILDTFINDGKKTLKNAMALAKRQEINAECVLHEKLLGSLSDLILKEAKEWKSDIIVMGTHANTGIKHLLLGSNAEEIARSSRIPVLIVHSAPEE